jgi:aspartate carbamoyltransferase regulatory subunit
LLQLTRPKIAIYNKLQLVKDFGTTKAKKAMINLKANSISDENISSISAMQEIITQNAINQEMNIKAKSEEQLEAKIENMREILPPFDHTTEYVEDIFNQDSSTYSHLIFSHE